MSSLLVHCHGEKTHFSRSEKNVFVKPNEQCRACSYIVMARIGNRQHGALGEVERQNAFFKERKGRLLYSCWAHNIKTSAGYYATFKKPQKCGKFVVRQQKGVFLSAFCMSYYTEEIQLWRKKTRKNLELLKKNNTFAPHLTGRRFLYRRIKGSLGEWLKPPVC